MTWWRVKVRGERCRRSAVARRRKVTANQIIAYYETNSDVLNLPDIPNITKFQSVLEFHVIFQLIWKNAMTTSARHGILWVTFWDFHDGL